MTGTPPYRRVASYLADYAADRALVYTDLHRAQVDRIYATDPRVKGWTIHWYAAARIPYARKHGIIIYGHPVPAHTAAAVARQLIPA